MKYLQRDKDKICELDGHLFVNVRNRLSDTLDKQVSYVLYLDMKKLSWPLSLILERSMRDDLFKL